MMNRPIKFRGKRVDNGEWIIGSLIERYYPIITDDRFVIVPNDDFIFYNEDIKPSSFDKYAVIPETVGQFTGLLDKNGKEIWEGDILRRECMNSEFLDDPTQSETVIYNSQVYWMERQARWGIKNKTKTGGWYNPLTSNKVYNNKAEVIGNIHDNPKLINK